MPRGIGKPLSDDNYNYNPSTNRKSVSDSFSIPRTRRTDGRASSGSTVGIPYYPTLKLSSWYLNRHDGAGDEKRPDIPATLPQIKARFNNAAFRRRPSLRTFDSVSTIHSLNSTRLPDRFVPVRNSVVTTATESFRSNKDPCGLTTDERLLRHADASPDAFNPRRRVTSPIPQVPRPSPRRVFSASRSGGGGASVLTFRRDPPTPSGERQVSVGTVWTVGGVAPPSSGVPDGRGGLLGSGTNAPLYTASFTAIKPNSREEVETHEARLATALNLDRVSRIIEFRGTSAVPRPFLAARHQDIEPEFRTAWRGTEWVMGGRDRILDAPNLRDDFYCSVLAYSATTHTLAVGLGSCMWFPSQYYCIDPYQAKLSGILVLYAWSESQGVHLLNSGPQTGSWLTTLAFSSSQGGKSILAFGRSDGKLSLMSLYDSMLPRFEVQQPYPIACVTWRPLVTPRPSSSPSSSGALVKTEDLLVGDEVGNIYYYSVEWPEGWEVTRSNWSGSMRLLVRISIHTQQICGLSFSQDGSMFATGGNDNLCCLFTTTAILHESINTASGEVTAGADGIRRIHSIGGRDGVTDIRSGAERHRWVHGAAVKAIAFCPWREGLVATGGGSNDKCIHFYHATSGACLATISVAAQVTSLIWSTTRREIAATFGYAQPEHSYRIAVFSWPDCKQVAAIPWDGDHRALYAIAYPGGPNESQTSREGGRGMTRTAVEGCIVVASSDESVKFHEIWTSCRKATTGGEGLLGGSDILEGLEGIDKEGEVIR